MRHLLLALLIAAGLPHAAVADEIARLLDRLQAQTGVERPFTEERYNPLLAEPVQVRGYVRMDADGRLWKHIEAPFEESVSLDAERATLERDGVVRELDLARSGVTGGYLQSLHALLSGDRQRLEQRFAIERRPADGTEGWRLALVPRERRLRRHLDELVVAGSGATILRIRTVQGDDSWQEMRFTDPAAP